MPLSFQQFSTFAMDYCNMTLCHESQKLCQGHYIKAKLICIKAENPDKENIKKNSNENDTKGIITSIQGLVQKY